MIMKRLSSMILVVVTLFLCLAVPVVAASDLKLTNEVYPTEIVEGNTFSVYGIITSSNTITEFTIGVYKTDGSAAFSHTGSPGTKSYDLHNIDYLMTFAKLKAGNYTYRIKASDTVEKNVLLLEKKFKVAARDQFDTLKISSYTAPESIMKGSTFSVKGIISSDYNITAVTCSVRNENGNLEFTKTVNPETKTYDINELDQYMTFSQLDAGSYVYKVVASDTYNKSKVLLEKKFTVNAPQPPDPGYGEVVWDVIDLSYWNEINSWKEIAKNVDAVVLRIGYRATGNKKIGEDVKFQEFYKNAKAQGIPVGCYFFSAAVTVAEAVEEAKYVLKTLKDNSCVLEMPVYFDIETKAQEQLPNATATAIVRAFCEEIEKGGFYSGVYCNKNFATVELFPDQLSDFHFWIAQYASECAYEGPYGMWQYSDKGSIPGIKGNVDLNFCFYDYPTIIKELGMSGNKPPVNPPKPSASYKFNSKQGAVLDLVKKTISNVPGSLKPDDFTSKYLTLSNGAQASYTNTVAGCIATGTTVKITGSGKTLGEFMISVSGDVDMNAKINSTDALLTLQYTVEKRRLAEISKLSADVTGDGKINATDALKILKRAVGK